MSDPITDAIAAVARATGVSEARIWEAHRNDHPAVNARNKVWAKLHEAGVSADEIGHRFDRSRNTVNRVLRAIKTGVNTNLRDPSAERGGIGRDRSIAPARPAPPVLPVRRADWTEIDWMKAMAHEENQAVRAVG